MHHDACFRNAESFVQRQRVSDDVVEDVKNEDEDVKKEDEDMKTEPAETDAPPVEAAGAAAAFLAEAAVIVFKHERDKTRRHD